jgi:hypothetical protein
MERHLGIRGGSGATAKQTRCLNPLQDIGSCDDEVRKQRVLRA